MSETDRFIEEVNEELRRDKLFSQFRKYGWIAVLAVFLIVGGTAYREFSISTEKSRAESMGDAILAALQLDTTSERSNALGKIEILDDNDAILVALLRAAENSLASNNAESAKILEQLEASDVSSAYVQLANFKKLILEGSELSHEARVSGLEIISDSASPYRLFADEQLALIDLLSGDKQASIKRLTQIVEDATASESLRQRATQLMIILGAKTNITES